MSLIFERYFTKNHPDEPYFGITWKKFTAEIPGSNFKLENAEFPDFWSQTAVDIVANKYFYGREGEERETSLKHLINRVVSTIGDWGLSNKYFDTPNAIIFQDELKYMLVHQMFSFNSPVWFNLGNPHNEPQISACFINSIEDTMESIAENNISEMEIFRRGSGAGKNSSKLRSSREHISGGGFASGPCSFMKINDATAAVTKSGGKCLPGKQIVFTLNGRKPVSELENKDFQVISYDPKLGKHTVKNAKCWKSGNKPIIELITDKGLFYLSNDHPVKMLDDGSFKRVDSLQSGMSLWPSFIGEQDGYLFVQHPHGQGKELLHRIIARDLGKHDISNKIVHHKDGNRSNNNINNLEVLTQSEHAYMHNKELVDNNKHTFQLNDYLKSRSDNGMHRSSKFWNNEDKIKIYKDKQSNILIESGRAVEMQKLAVRQKMLNTGYKLINSGYNISSQDLYVSARKSESSSNYSYNQLIDPILSEFNTYDEYYKELRDNNHEVLSIKLLQSEDVYSIEVLCDTEDDKSANSGHNYTICDMFGTDNGIIVSNTRRAAKMEILDVDHGDIIKFIKQKGIEEAKAKALIESGFSGAYDDPEGAYGSVYFQNSNQSVRVTDAFMKAVENNEDWALLERYPVELSQYENFNTYYQGSFFINNNSHYLMKEDGFYKVIEWIPAKDLFNIIIEEAWKSGDPGIQFHDTINEWHTCPADGKINASNPCSEYMFLDDTSCNLASLNLMKFLDPDNNFHIEKFIYSTKVIITAMDILIDEAHYPTQKISERTRLYRTLGLGYTNLGALLIYKGLPYDSDEGRKWAAAITALMHSVSYSQSKEIANELEPFPRFENNKEYFKEVIKKHNDAIAKLGIAVNDDWNYSNLEEVIRMAAAHMNSVYRSGTNFKLRNAQVTVLAPTGTISFMMDASTTGIEPAIALESYKSLAGGGMIKLIIPEVEWFLSSNGYHKDDDWHLDKNISKVLQTAIGDNQVPYIAHVKMMEAVQPFLSGAISKTVNMPNSATFEDIKNVYFYAWKHNLKAIAIYRDGCKSSQPVNVTKKDNKKPDISKSVNTKESNLLANGRTKPIKKPLPETRESMTHKFNVAGYKGYLTVGLYPDGEPGEIFIKISKGGSTINGTFDGWATTISQSLQYGIPLSEIINKMKYTKYEPAGITSNAQIKFASSIGDYIARWLENEFVEEEEHIIYEVSDDKDEDDKENNKDTKEIGYDGPPCPKCGNFTMKSGSCYVCIKCGETTGCG